MNYNEVVDLIDTTVKFGCKPGLERTEKLLELLGNPHKKLRVIHVAGTNGKGSTAAMLASILSSAGYRTGMYISPHLFRNTERMTIDGIEITEEDFAEYATQVLSMVRLMGEKGLEEPTQFEMYTAMAFLYFERKKVDFAVVEVGLGGRFDATNAAEPLLSALQNPVKLIYVHLFFWSNPDPSSECESAGIVP